MDFHLDRYFRRYCCSLCCLVGSHPEATDRIVDYFYSFFAWEAYLAIVNEYCEEIELVASTIHIGFIDFTVMTLVGVLIYCVLYWDYSIP